MTAALIAVLTLTALWHIGRHIRTNLRRAAATVDQIRRHYDDQDAT